jgi:O-antigen/teichoic acid export membrane protein
MLTDRIKLFLFGMIVMLPLLGLVALIWRRFYREDVDNTARRVVKNSALPIAANLLNRVIDLGFAAIMLRALGPAGNGDYALAALIAAQYFLTISNWGLNDLTVREVAADHTQAPRLFSITLLLRCGIAALLIPIAAGLIGTYALIGNPLNAAAIGALALLMLHLFPAALASACSASFQAFQRMEVPALIALVTNIAKVLIGTAVLVGVTSLSTGQRVVALAIVAFAVTSLNGVLFLLLQRHLLFHARLVWDWGEGRRLLRSSFPLLLNSLLLVVFFRFDTLILRGVSDSSAVGTYDAAYKWINMTTIIPAYFVAAVFPLLARYAATDRPALVRAYHHALSLLQIIAWPITSAVVVLSGELIGLLGGREYLPGAALALAILIWFLPLSYANGVTQYVLIALQRQNSITVSFAIAAIFNLAANVLLIPLYGYFAAATITVATEVVILLPFLRTLRQEKILPPLLALAWRPAVAAVLMGAAMLAIRSFDPQLPLLVLAAAVAAPPVYLAALWLLGAFGVEERALMRRILGRV